MTDPNTALMEVIHSKYSIEIDQASKNSNVPAAFLAALIANESGGDPHAKRFEKNVLAALWEVLLGRKAAYGSIGAEDLRAFLVPGLGSPAAIDADTQRSLVTDAMQRLDSLATSWGLTQIMGYNVFTFSAVATTVDLLQTTEGNLRIALLMVSKFANRFHLEVAADSADLFRCWNTGYPAGTTFDPQYVPNGLARMKIYADLELQASRESNAT